MSPYSGFLAKLSAKEDDSKEKTIKLFHAQAYIENDAKCNPTWKLPLASLFVFCYNQKMVQGKPI